MLVDGYDQHLRELGLRRLLPKKGKKQQHYHHTAYAIQSSVFGNDDLYRFGVVIILNLR